VPPSKSERELLKTLYRLSHEGTDAHTSEIAARLHLAPGTVTAGVKRLAARELVDYRPYRGVELTEVGRVLALAVIRRHRIVERLLADVLGYSWQDADRLSVTFEHQIPQEVEDRIFAILGHPLTCPHGFPIPEPQSSDLPRPQRLTDLAQGQSAVVALPGGMDPDAVIFLETLGVRPGVEIELRERQPFSGPLVVNVNGIDHTVGEGLADRIFAIVSPQKRREASA